MSEVASALGQAMCRAYGINPHECMAIEIHWTPHECVAYATLMLNEGVVKELLTLAPIERVRLDER